MLLQAELRGHTHLAVNVGPGRLRVASALRPAAAVLVHRHGATMHVRAHLRVTAGGLLPGQGGLAMGVVDMGWSECTTLRSLR